MKGCSANSSSKPEGEESEQFRNNSDPRWTGGGAARPREHFRQGWCV